MPTETRPSDEEIKAVAAKAEIPDGSSFSEAYQRLIVVSKLPKADAERWAVLITGESAD